jgi:hypothetical protein
MSARIWAAGESVTNVLSTLIAVVLLWQRSSTRCFESVRRARS